MDDTLPTSKELMEADIAASFDRIERGDIMAIDPDLASDLGAFEENAIDEADAAESRFDHLTEEA